MTRRFASTLSTTAIIIALNAGSALAQSPRGPGQPPANAGDAAAKMPDMSMRVYDLRSLLPTAAQVAVPNDMAAAAMSLDAVVRALVESLMYRMVRLDAGIYAIEGDGKQHEQFENTIAQLKALASEVFQVDLRLARVPKAQVLQIGTPLPAGMAGLAELAAIRMALPKRTPTHTESIRETSYVSGWQPVVGSSAVGYDAKQDTVRDGVILTATVSDASPSANQPGALRLQLAGSVSQAEFKEGRSPALGSGVTDPVGLTYSMPVVQRRTVLSDVTITPGVATIVGLVDGFAADQSIVIIAQVNRPGAQPAPK